MTYCKCKHNIDQAMISGILGSRAVCNKCRLVIKPKRNKAQDPLKGSGVAKKWPGRKS